MMIRVIDFETTGFPTDEGGAAICEAAYCDVMVGGDQVVVSPSPVAFLCDPERPIPPIAQAIHHISDADVKGARSQKEAIDAILSDDPDVIYCAHHADFEREFIVPASSWICTYKVALRLWPDAPAHGNQVLRYFLGLDLDPAKASPPHRAGPDAYVTAHLLAMCVGEKRASIEDMLRWSSGPALLPRVTFGKHRGARWEDLPDDYLDWVAVKSDLDGDTKANARYHLKKRAVAA